MKETLGPPLRAGALTAFIVGLAMLLLHPPSFAGVGNLLALLAGVFAVVLITAWVTVMLRRQQLGVSVQAIKHERGAYIRRQSPRTLVELDGNSHGPGPCSKDG